MSLRRNRFSYLLSFLGNTLEFYDFTVYGVLVSVFANLFFPADQQWLSLISSWGAFAAAFLMRPLGAVFFGYIGDYWGRRKALSLSILNMAIGTFLIGCLPTFHQIGFAAPVLLILLRFLQGLSTGGEYNGSAIFALEHFGQKLPGTVGGIITSSCVLGAILGTFIGKICLLIFDSDIAWRIPFLFGGLWGFILYLSRAWLAETPVYESVNKSLIPQRFLTISSKLLPQFLTNLSLGIFNASMSYIVFGFSVQYLNRYMGYDQDTAMLLNLYGLFTYLFITPISGYLYDQLGVHRYVNFLFWFVFFSVFPIIWMLQSIVITSVIFSFIGLGIISGLVAGPAHAFLQENIPTEIRYRFVALSFSIGMAIGGATPLILTTVIEKTGYLSAPAVWIFLVNFFFLIIFKFSKKNYISKASMQKSVPKSQPQSQSVKGSSGA